MMFNKGILVNLYHNYALILGFLIYVKMAKLTTVMNQMEYYIMKQDKLQVCGFHL